MSQNNPMPASPCHPETAASPRLGVKPLLLPGLLLYFKLHS
jgi:hypothetical protein